MRLEEGGRRRGGRPGGGGREKRGEDGRREGHEISFAKNTLRFYGNAGGSEAMILTCPSCGKQNRSPAERLADTGRCGSCKTPISPVNGPIDADPAIFEEVTRGAKVPVLVDYSEGRCGPVRIVGPQDC